jgi:uroporphyrin-3 C-methyltransferase/uroporphyrinogen III methyltransferase/synthase
MNELPHNPEQPQTGGPVIQPETIPVPAPGGPKVEPRVPDGIGFGGFWAKPHNLAIATLAVLLALQAWSSHSRINRLHEDVARTLQKDIASNAETAQLVREVHETAKELQVKVGVLESRQSESQSQQAALEQMYQDISKNRDEWALSEIEQVLSTASQQLQLAGNVQGALIALANADRSLSRSDKPQFITIRRAIARDIDKLKALQQVDQAGMALRIDNAIGQIDNLPLLSDERPAEPIAPPRAKGAKAAPAPDQDKSTLGQRVTTTWRAWSQEMWDDIRQLIRVRTVDTPEALMLSPSESYFVRENLKLRLLNARLALLSRNEGTFRDDLGNAQQMLLKYFDTKARSTQAVQGLLRQVQANNVTIDVPDLSESLNAVRNYKSKP